MSDKRYLLVVQYCGGGGAYQHSAERSTKQSAIDEGRRLLDQCNEADRFDIYDVPPLGSPDTLFGIHSETRWRTPHNN